MPRSSMRSAGMALGIVLALGVSGAGARAQVAGASKPVSVAQEQPRLVVKNPPLAEVRARTAVQQEELSQAPPDAANVGTATRAFVTASNGDSRAKLTTGFALVNATPLSLNVRIGGDTPLTKGADEATLLDYRRLGDGTSVELAMQGLVWRAPRRRPSDLINWCSDAKKRIPDPLPRVKDCNDFGGDDLDGSPRTLYREFLDSAGWTEPWTFEITANAARSNRKFLNATTFSPDSQDRVAYAVGANVGYTFSERLGLRTGLVSLGYAYAVKYRGRDTAQVCLPAGPTGGLRCRTGPLGEPLERLTNVVAAELRGFVSSRWGIAPKVAYLARDRDWQITTPLYFAPSKNGVLIGGLAPSYTTNGSRWDLRLFVGATGFGLAR